MRGVRGPGHDHPGEEDDTSRGASIPSRPRESLRIAGPTPSCRRSRWARIDRLVEGVGRGISCIRGVGAGRPTSSVVPGGSLLSIQIGGESVELLLDIYKAEISSTRPRDHDEIPGLHQVFTIRPEPLPKESLDPVSLRRSTNFLRDHEPDATVRFESWCPRDQEVPGAEDLRSAPVLPVLPRLADAQLRRKPMARRIQELLLRDRGD